MECISNGTGDTWITFEENNIITKSSQRNEILMGHNFKSQTDRRDKNGRKSRSWIADQDVGIRSLPLTIRAVVAIEGLEGIKLLYYLQKEDVFSLSSELNTFAVASGLKILVFDLPMEKAPSGSYWLPLFDQVENPNVERTES